MNNKDVKDRLDRQLIWWILIICFAYHYKVIACGFLGILCGFEFICYTVIHGITSNHWFETLIYAPLMWYAVTQINETVFFPTEDTVYDPKRLRRKRIGQFFCAIYLYGMGVHITNTLEIYSREQLGIIEGPLYDQIYWLDEHVSHWIQFGAFFLIMGWFIAWDRLDRIHGSYIALFTGIAHGLERGIGVIEGNSAVMAIGLTSITFIATIYRWIRHDRDFARSWADFFFRHGFTFTLSIPLTLLLYSFIFGGFVQPSEMGTDAWKVVAFSLVFIGVIFVLGVGLDKKLSVNPDSSSDNT